MNFSVPDLIFIFSLLLVFVIITFVFFIGEQVDRGIALEKRIEKDKLYEKFFNIYQNTDADYYLFKKVYFQCLKRSKSDKDVFYSAMYHFVELTEKDILPISKD